MEINSISGILPLHEWLEHLPESLREEVGEAVAATATSHSPQHHIHSIMREKSAWLQPSPNYSAKSHVRGVTSKGRSMQHE